MERCPVCDNETNFYKHKDIDQIYEVDCKRCGKFKITDTVISKIKSEEGEKENERYILSYWIKHHQYNDYDDIINRELYNKIINETTLPNLQEKIDGLIRLIGKKQNNRYRQVIEMNIEYISPDIGAIDWKEVNWIADNLRIEV